MSDKTNFQKACEFNETFGVTVHKKPQLDVFYKNPDLVKYRWDLIHEETNELKDALKDHDMVETVDALADILVVVYGAAASFGIDLDKAYDLVHQSNMSKICKTEDEAIQTVEWYKKNESRYDSPNYKKAPDGINWIVYNESTGKVLKSIKYTKVDLKTFLAEESKKTS